MQVSMENVVLIIHLILALGLIAIVLMQRSEGGGLGMGGGGGGANSGRAPATALGKVTWILAIGFIITSISLTIIAAQKSAGASVLDRFGGAAPTENSAPAGLPSLDGSLLPPAEGDNAPLVPSAD
jgi:preprotein translocase subunit SecG